jgi:hypothetical protein
MGLFISKFFTALIVALWAPIRLFDRVVLFLRGDAIDKVELAKVAGNIIGTACAQVVREMRDSGALVYDSDLDDLMVTEENVLMFRRRSAEIFSTLSAMDQGILYQTTLVFGVDYVEELEVVGVQAAMAQQLANNRAAR